MRKEHNDTWTRRFISVLQKGANLGAKLSEAKVSFEGPHFTEPSTGEGEGLDSKKSPEPWLNHMRNPQY